MTWPFFTVLALLDQDLLVDAGGRVRAHELADRINVNAVRRVVLDLLLAFGQLAVFGDDDLVAGDGGDLAGLLRDDDGARIARDALLEAGGDERRFGDEQRHGLALHVRTHQRAVGVVVLEERNQARRHRDELLRRNVHVIDARRVRRR